MVEADTDRMEPELDNWSVVELVYLASHGDEAVAVLNLLNILLSGCLCGYFTQHCLETMQTPHGAREERVKGVRDRGMERVGRGKCDGLGRRSVGGDAEKGWRWGQVCIREEGWEESKNKEKRRKKEKWKRVTLWLLHSFNITIKEASTGNVIIPKCEMCV